MSSPAVAPQQFRDLMAGVCAPVTVVTTTIDGTPHGATVSSFSSLSLDPPLISVALNRNSALLAGIRSAGRFGVNLLGLAQDELAMTQSGSVRRYRLVSQRRPAALGRGRRVDRLRALSGG